MGAVETADQKLREDLLFFDSLVKMVPPRFYFGAEGETNSWKFHHNKGARAAAKQAAKENSKKAKRAKFDPDNVVGTLSIQRQRAAEEAAEAMEHANQEAGTVAVPPPASGSGRVASHEELVARLHQRMEEARLKKRKREGQGDAAMGAKVGMDEGKGDGSKPGKRRTGQGARNEAKGGIEEEGAARKEKKGGKEGRHAGGAGAEGMEAHVGAANAVVKGQGQERSVAFGHKGKKTKQKRAEREVELRKEQEAGRQVGEGREVGEGLGGVKDGEGVGGGGKGKRQGGEKESSVARREQQQQKVNKGKLQTTQAVAPSLQFSRIEVGEEGGSRKHRKKPKNIVGARTKDKQRLLQKAEALKDELEASKGTSEGQVKASKYAWSTALERAAGHKVLDDPKLLKRSIKREEQKKKQKGAKWQERVSKQREFAGAKQEKRKENIRRRQEGILERRKEKRLKKLLSPGRPKA